jgi:hypothetical protein
MDRTVQYACQFGVNFIDGRIKCYGGEKWARFVRGNTNIGVNDFSEVGNTIVDGATGLQWMKYDSGHYADTLDGTMEWPDALHYCETLELDGHSDWRLPDAHELHSIVDYDRSPDHTNSAAIDSIFDTTVITSEMSDIDYAWYWTSTTHFDGIPLGSAAVYIAFGRATGNFTNNGGAETPKDVHGAGAQRSEPKVGPLPDPNYRGPQGDFIRIWNMVRCVRGSSIKSSEAPDTCATHTAPPSAATGTEHPTKRPSSQRGVPNFIVMHPDDLEFFEVWSPPAHFSPSKIVDYPSGSDLPNMNFLREKGVQFNRAYAASSMCGTSRYR